MKEDDKNQDTKNEDDVKIKDEPNNVDNLKIEDKPKNIDDLRNEDESKYEDNLKLKTRLISIVSKPIKL